MTLNTSRYIIFSRPCKNNRRTKSNGRSNNNSSSSNSYNNNSYNSSNSPMGAMSMLSPMVLMVCHPMSKLIDANLILISRSIYLHIISVKRSSTKCCREWNSTTTWPTCASWSHEESGNADGKLFIGTADYPPKSDLSLQVTCKEQPGSLATSEAAFRRDQTTNSVSR